MYHHIALSSILLLHSSFPFSPFSAFIPFTPISPFSPFTRFSPFTPYTPFRIFISLCLLSDVTTVFEYFLTLSFHELRLFIKTYNLDIQNDVNRGSSK